MEQIVSETARSNLITPERLRDHRFCSRFHANRRVLGIWPKHAPDAFGGRPAVIDALLAGFRAAQALPPLDARGPSMVFQGARDYLGSGYGRQRHAMEVSRDLAYVVCVEAVLRQSNFLGTHTILGVDVPFSFPHLNPDTGRVSPIWLRAGMIHLAVRNAATNQIRVVQFRTTDAPIDFGAIYWRNLALDTSISQVILGADVVFGGGVDKAIHAVIRKTALRAYSATPKSEIKYRQRKSAEASWSETDERLLYKGTRLRDEGATEYYDRILESMKGDPSGTFAMTPVARREEAIVEHLRDSWATSQIMREEQSNGWFPKNTDSCHSRGECPYFGACSNTVSLENDSRFQHLENVHPELPADFAVEREEIIEPIVKEPARG